MGINILCKVSLSESFSVNPSTKVKSTFMSEEVNISSSILTPSKLNYF